MESQVIRFRSETAFIGLTGTVDKTNRVVHGVSLITGGMEAEGHDLEVDDTTTKQLFTLAKTNEQVPVYLDHGSGIKDLNGYLDNFRMDGVKLRGDWHLLEEHKETTVMLERADRQPKTFGLSVSFKGKGVAVTGKAKKAARAEKLLSADVVPRPAANKDGLFGALDGDSVDTNKKDMEPTLQQIVDSITALGTKITGMETKLGGFETSQKTLADQLAALSSGGDQEAQLQREFDTLSQLHASTDEQLTALGLTRAEVDAAVAEWDASVPAGADTEADAAAEAQAQADAAAAAQAAQAAGAAPAGAAGAQAVALSALSTQVKQLQAVIDRDRTARAQQAEEVQLQALDANMNTLAAQRDQAIELAVGVVAENEALRLHIKTGTRPVKSGGSASEVRMFAAGADGELHAFQVRIKQLQTEGHEGKKFSLGQAIVFASAENPASHQEWLQLQAKDRAVIRG